MHAQTSARQKAIMTVPFTLSCAEVVPIQQEKLTPARSFWDSLAFNLLCWTSIPMSRPTRTSIKMKQVYNIISQMTVSQLYVRSTQQWPSASMPLLNSRVHTTLNHS